MIKNNNVRFTITVVVLAVLLFAFKIFEIDFGRCLNDAGDGKLYNGEPYYNYISYNGIGQQDDIIMTFSVNDLKYKECVWRGDVVILRNTKES